MPRKVAIIAGLVAITLALAIVFWIVNVVFSPHIFFSVARHVPYKQGSPVALAALSAIAPLIVAIPFGFSFGLFPTRRPMALGFFVASVAAGLNLAHAVWSSMWAGYSYLGSRTWVDFLGLALLVILFVAAAALGARVASQWQGRQRLVAGCIAWVSLTAIGLASAYVGFQAILGSARAA